ncbi:MAG: hypothetical protein HY788_08010 [Deltaproteobacteria bacterium]|nr:hypothetical protein [Deltaproteobacteria bacterium]
MAGNTNRTAFPVFILKWAYRILLFGTLVTVLSIILSAVNISCELGNIHNAIFTTQTSYESIREALDAAYRFGQGEETYGLPADKLHPAHFPRTWAKQSERIAGQVVREPWFPSYKAGVEAFRRNGMVGFLTQFDEELNSNPMLSEDPVFREFARKNRLPLLTARQRSRAVSQYMASLGYVPETASSFEPFNRLLIANFIAPAEARGYRESLGMDKLTHYYHAKLRAEDKGRISTVLLGVGIELSELFLGHHKQALIAPALRNPGSFHLRWIDSRPRLYPDEAFYSAHRDLFGPPNRTYDQWRAQAKLRFFSWADLAANWAGGSATSPSVADLAVSGLLAATVGSLAVRVINRLRVRFGVIKNPVKKTDSTPRIL